MLFCIENSVALLLWLLKTSKYAWPHDSSAKTHRNTCGFSHSLEECLYDPLQENHSVAGSYLRTRCFVLENVICPYIWKILNEGCQSPRRNLFVSFILKDDKDSLDKPRKKVSQLPWPKKTGETAALSTPRDSLPWNEISEVSKELEKISSFQKRQKAFPYFDSVWYEPKKPSEVDKTSDPLYCPYHQCLIER